VSPGEPTSVGFLVSERRMLTKYRHHLPHWNLEGAVYFITFKAYSEKFTRVETEIILRVIREGHGKKYTLVAVQVMPDHVHLVLSPLDSQPLAKVMQWIKGVTARQLNIHRGKQGSIWMVDYYDRIIRNEKELDEKLKYIYENPIRSGLVENAGDWSGWYLNEEAD